MSGPRAPQPDAQPGRPAAAPPLPRAQARVDDNGSRARQSQPDLARRAALERSRGRLVLTAMGFGVLFAAVGTKLAIATMLDPREPRRIAMQAATGAPVATAASRAPITDRNGEILAVSLPVTELVANPRQIENPAQVADQLARILPQMDRAKLAARLSGDKQFAYIARALTPRQTQAVNDLGVAGLEFHTSERRYYPQGRAAVHVLGNVDVDNEGVSGVERYFNERLRQAPDQELRLSIDVRVNVALRDTLTQAISDFNGIGGAGMLEDVRTGEIIGMVSLPDYDAGDIGGATPEQRFNRATVGTYEPGSTFKLLTTSMALDYGTANLYSTFDAGHPIRIGRFTIRDFQGKNRVLSLPEVIQFSSNIGAARIAIQVGAQRQREFLGRMNMLSRLHLELPELATPLAPPASLWRDASTYTIGFGQGISVTPLHVINAVSTIANGGTLRQPTLLMQPPGTQRDGVRVITEKTTELVRKLMRVVVTDGSGKTAEVPGYFLGGKTGTAQKAGPNGGYVQGKRITAFAGAFPMQAPRYAIYLMIDEPKPNAHSYGYATAGWVAAPAAARAVARIAPILGMVPDDPKDPAILQSLYVPLQPGRGPAPRNPAPTGAAQAAAQPASQPGAAAAPATTRPASTRNLATPPRPLAPPATTTPPGTAENPTRGPLRTTEALPAASGTGGGRWDNTYAAAR
ncbi:peptidoglycan D,D-transpeptidase FtsI family protein [Roseomonas elaeocarpi]|uniref:Peptidoglycan D,D-transpeptidase FtsI family protein n=1 Tax=Roseomonas elaeocarpi TaxID=907779 RepID=A0ABV6JUP8_9PROT